jgi:hypothetical protein
VKPSVLDEDGRGVFAGEHTAGEEPVGDVAFERRGIVNRHRGRGVHLHAARLEQIEIGVVAGHQEDMIRRQTLALAV